MRQHLRAGGLLVALADCGHDAGVMIGAAGGRIVAAVEQDDERGARDQFFQEAEIDAVAAHLGDELVKIAGEPDGGARVAAQLRLALLGEMLLEAADPYWRNR